MVQLRYGLVSITGNFRDNNEDRGLADPMRRFFMVADGMGGQAAGEKASELATEFIPRVLERSIDFQNDPPEKVLRCIDEAVAAANGEIMALGQVDPQYHHMGTTIVFLLHVAGKLYAGGIGDSRAYRLRDGKMSQLTTDHSLTQALLDAGTIKPEEAETHRYRNVLYRYLGTKEGGTGNRGQGTRRETGRPHRPLFRRSDRRTGRLEPETAAGRRGRPGEDGRVDRAGRGAGRVEGQHHLPGGVRGLSASPVIGERHRQASLATKRP